MSSRVRRELSSHSPFRFTFKITARPCLTVEEQSLPRGGSWRPMLASTWSGQPALVVNILGTSAGDCALKTDRGGNLGDARVEG